MEYIEAIRSLAPLVVDTMGALMALATVLQALLMAASKFFPKLGTVAHWFGIVAFDLKQATDGAKKLLAKGKKNDGDTTPPAGPA